MPARDGTGPRGEGSRTGWGMGRCNPEPIKTSNMADDKVNPPGVVGGSFIARWFRRRRAHRANRR
jgi:hypothetical protein